MLLLQSFHFFLSGNLDYRLAYEGHTYNLHYGTLEIFVSTTGYWHPICDAQAPSATWYNETANQVCRELGHNGGHAVLGSKYGRSRAQGHLYDPVKYIDAGTVIYGNCDTTKHLGELSVFQRNFCHENYSVECELIDNYMFVSQIYGTI